MNKSTKSALLSALVFPGVGHAFLKCYKRAFILIVTSAAAIVFLIKQALDRAEAIINQMETGGNTMNTQEIAELISNSPNESFNLAAIVITVCWFFGIIDSIRAAKRQD